MHYQVLSAIRAVRHLRVQRLPKSPRMELLLRARTTDQVGSFAIVPRAKKKVYDLKISLDPNFNPLIVHVRVSRWTKKLLDLKLEVST